SDAGRPAKGSAVHPPGPPDFDRSNPLFAGTLHRRIRINVPILPEDNMPKLGRVALIGAWGKRYGFSVYLREDPFKPLAAVYFLAKRIPFAEGEAEYTWIYVG